MYHAYVSAYLGTVGKGRLGEISGDLCLDVSEIEKITTERGTQYWWGLIDNQLGTRNCLGGCKCHYGMPKTACQKLGANGYSSAWMLLALKGSKDSFPTLYAAPDSKCKGN